MPTHHPQMTFLGFFIFICTQNGIFRATDGIFSLWGRGNPAASSNFEPRFDFWRRLPATLGRMSPHSRKIQYFTDLPPLPSSFQIKTVSKEDGKKRKKKCNLGHSRSLWRRDSIRSSRVTSAPPPPFPFPFPFSRKQGKKD